MNTLIRVSCSITTEAALTEEIMRLNANGWYVQSGQKCNKAGEIALQCIYMGYRASETQNKEKMRCYIHAQ